MVKLTRYKCKKCGHKWIPRTDREPAVCPNCKNARWQEKGKRKYVRKEYAERPT